MLNQIIVRLKALLKIFRFFKSFSVSKAFFKIESHDSIYLIGSLRPILLNARILSISEPDLPDDKPFLSGL